MQRIIVGLIVVLAGWWIYTSGDTPVTGGDGSGDPVVQFADDDSEMGAAMTAARATFPQFLNNTVDGSGNGPENASVKVAFDIGDGGAEIIWVGRFNWDGGTNMTGLLANQPNYMGDLNAGDPVSFSTDMVRDWALTEMDGTMWGHYTTRVIVPQLDDETAAALNAVLSDNPVPADWN